MSSRAPLRRVAAFMISVLCFGMTSCRKDTGAPPAPEPPGANASKPTVVPQAEAGSIDDALKSLLTAWETVGAVSAKITTKAKRDIGDRAESTGDGVYNLQVVGGRMRLRYYLGNLISFWIGDDHYITKEYVEFVSDGAVLEQLTIQHEYRQMVKTRYRPSGVLQLGGRSVIDPLRADNKIKSMTAEQRNGRDALVFECVANDGSGTSTQTFDVETGIRVGWIQRDAAGEQVLAINLANLNLAPEFTAKDLTMVAAQNYTLIDETGPERVVIPWEELSKTRDTEDQTKGDQQNDDDHAHVDDDVGPDPK